MKRAGLLFLEDPIIYLPEREYLFMLGIAPVILQIVLLSRGMK